jgi:ribosomal protein L37AE/L43A
MRTVAHYYLPSEAHVPLSRLQSAGIRATLRDESTLQMNWLWSNAIGGVKIDVPDDDYHAAVEILELKPLENGLLTCPACESAAVSAQSWGVINALLMLTVATILPSRKIKFCCQDCGHRFTVNRVTGSQP